MAWDEEMLTIVRVLVNDQASKTYSDSSLTKVILVAARMVVVEIPFSNQYSVDVINESITPDPTAAETLDESFTNLVCLKAACITDRGAAILAAKQAIAVKDGASSVDLRGNLMGKLKLLEKGWCAVYEDAKREYLTSQDGIAGAAVMTPFRLYAYGGGYTRGSLFTSQRTRELY